MSVEMFTLIHLFFAFFLSREHPGSYYFTLILSISFSLCLSLFVHHLSSIQLLSVCVLVSSEQKTVRGVETCGL